MPYPPMIYFPPLTSRDSRSTTYNPVGRNGSPEIAAYILSRHPNVPPTDYSSHLLSPDPTIHPVQFLVKKAAYHGNAKLFRYLVTEYPTLLTTYNRNVEDILLSAMNGGTSIWKIILEVDPLFKDHEFSGHRGCTLENVVWRGSLVEGDEKMALLQLLLEEGADTDRAGAPVLEQLRCMHAEDRVMDLVWK
ncbi:MAG: hypothetical protein Q9221_008320 [Calogaya cf. arnoldii]